MSPENAYVDIVRARGVLSPIEAKSLIAKSESYALKDGGWTKHRHRHYPTTDLPVSALEDHEDIEQWIQNQIFPRLATWYRIHDSAWLVLRDLFIVKYSSNGQRGLAKHRDGCELSFGIALTDGFLHKTAGTYFPSFGHHINNVQIGELWTHPSLVLHRALPVQDTARYVLVGFVHVRPLWPWYYYRTWGAWGTTLREWQQHNEQESYALTLNPAVSYPPVSRFRLGCRRSRALIRTIFSKKEKEKADSSSLSRLLLYIAFVLCFFIVLLTLNLAFDFIRLFCFFTEPKISPIHRQQQQQQRDDDDCCHGRYHYINDEDDDAIERGTIIPRSLIAGRTRGVRQLKE
eukprot:CAMPEP_0197329476 /NCGR_PEP_ID=MMETSP0892-20130614/5851_1 /TAXON_ID=44058 ORGANISM="Aureoumbra lagunensis, Strain CCMP1510" /NCGR_SAMPLE_ID=MMETSP0892 /ASSEMBLY_ACC=CAM_ASM_000538 /LENGTH=345 /DNA_ID=CAMNT_0042826129 /DNA_START=148 /DNA_END=1182 /DNA_ORIENTATION=+